MKLVVTKRVSDWLRQTGIAAGSQVAIWAVKRAGQVEVKYQVKQPDQPVFAVRQGGVDFYVEFADEWFFSGKVTTIDYRDGRLVSQAVKEPVTTSVGESHQPAAAADASTAASRKYEEYWE